MRCPTAQARANFAAAKDDALALIHRSRELGVSAMVVLAEPITGNALTKITGSVPALSEAIDRDQPGSVPIEGPVRPREACAWLLALLFLSVAIYNAACAPLPVQVLSERELLEESR